MTENDKNEPEKGKSFPWLTEAVLHTLKGIQEPNGMLETYETCLAHIEELLFCYSEEMNLDDSRTLSYLRVLRMLRQDLNILGSPEDPKAGKLPDDANL